MPVDGRGLNRSIDVIQADYHKPAHAEAIRELLDAYAQDPMGGGLALAIDVKQQVVAKLAERPYAFSCLAYIDDKPVGLANCFEAFSTFACAPLVNIHDMAVLAEYRGQGVAQMLLAKVEQIAANKGCCKITLEVLSGNEAAKAAYQKFGFSDYQLDPSAGGALFWQKTLG